MVLAASLILASVLTASTPNDPLATKLPAPLALPASAQPLYAAPSPLLGGSSTLGYTYAEVNYVYTDLDDVPGTQNGYDATISWNILLGIYVQGTYANGKGTSDTENYKLGAGYHLPLGDKLDIFGLISYAHDYVKSGGASATGDGYEVDAGARFMLFEKLEVNGQIEWNHVDDDKVGVELGTRYYLAGPLSVGATVESLDQDFRFTAGVRFGF
jgi:hypothetical protein